MGRVRCITCFFSPSFLFFQTMIDNFKGTGPAPKSDLKNWRKPLVPPMYLVTGAKIWWQTIALCSLGGKYLPSQLTLTAYVFLSPCRAGGLGDRRHSTYTCLVKRNNWGYMSYCFWAREQRIHPFSFSWAFSLCLFSQTTHQSKFIDSF